MDTWLIYKLTGATDGGVFVTDVSNAARTNLMDIRSQQWHPETCSYFGLKADMLPEIKSNAEVFGYVKEGPLQGVAWTSLSKRHDTPLNWTLVLKRGLLCYTHTQQPLHAQFDRLICNAYCKIIIHKHPSCTRLTNSFHIAVGYMLLPRLLSITTNSSACQLLWFPGCGCVYTLAWCDISMVG